MKATGAVVGVFLLGVAIMYFKGPRPVVWERMETIEGEMLTFEVNAYDGWRVSEQWRAYTQDGTTEPGEHENSRTALGQDKALNLLFSTKGEVVAKLSPIIHDEHKAVYYFPTSRLAGSEARLWIESGKTGYTFRMNGAPVKGNPGAGDGPIRYYVIRKKASTVTEPVGGNR